MFCSPQPRIGQPLAHGRLTVFPLYSDQSTPSTYRLSSEALADGTVVVEEATQNGNVPTLIVDNKGTQPVLFLEGEELRGAKQNRVLNTTVLVAPLTRMNLPVSCVEQGRWRYTTAQFTSSDSHSSSKLRSVLKASVSDSTLSGRGHRSDQSGVWTEVSRQMTSHGASSATMAMADTYASKKETVADHITHLGYPTGASGLAVAVGGQVVLVDLFDSPDTCQAAWPRLLSGAVMDALEAPEAAPPSGDAVRDAVAKFQADGWRAVPAAGQGEEYRGDTGDRWHGSVLTQGGSVIHASLVRAGA